ncbi:MAG: hypothetical protein QM648_10045 [Solirubrobacterales bacterium]
MNTTTDPILLLRELRAAVAEPTREAELRARDAMFASRSGGRSRTRMVAAFAVCLLALVPAVVVLSPWTHTQSAQAAVDQLAETAADQPTMKLGPRDWIVSHYTARYSWIQDLTQERLDTLTARALAVAEMPGNDGHYLRRNSDNKPISDAEADAINRKQQRRIDRIRDGVKLDELPATHIEAWNESPYTQVRSTTGIGGGGGGNNTIHYGSPQQAAAGKILQRAGIGGVNANPTDFGGMEISSLPAQAIGDESSVEGLSTEPDRMRDQLAKSGAIVGLSERPKAGSTLDIFGKTAGVVFSPYASPQQRAAAIRLAASLPGVEIDQHARDSAQREGIGMALAIPGGSMQFVFNEADSRLLGMVVQIDDVKTFVGDSYAIGKDHKKIPVLPPYDSATVAVSYDALTISRGAPPCKPTFCMTGPHPSKAELERMRRIAGTG